MTTDRKRRISPAIAVIVTLALASVGAACGDNADAPYPGPDLIYYNAVIVTMDGASDAATALAIEGETIAAVGSDEEILELQGSATEKINAGGRTIMPGFVDPHTHILSHAESQGMTLDEAQDLALKNGITAIGDPYAEAGFVAAMLLLESRQGLRVRTSLYLPRHTGCGDDLGDWYKKYPPTPGPERLLRVVGVKLFADGGSCGSAALSQPAPGFGDLWFTQQQMDDAVAEAHALGYQVAIHAVGDRGIEQAQNAIEAALAGRPNRPRHRIEHNYIIRPDLIPRYSEIGIISIVPGYSRACAPNYFYERVLGPEHTSWIVPYRALLGSGAHVAWHSDYPFGPTNPLLHLPGFITQKAVATGETYLQTDDGGHAPGTVCDPPEWAKHHTVSVEEGLRMMTIDAAYALGQDGVIGSLEPGKLADVIVLSDNPLTADSDAIKDIQVLIAMVGGNAEYCIPEQPDICPKTDRPE